MSNGNGLTHVRVVRIVVDADMRKTRSVALDDIKMLADLGRGQVILMLNRAGTIARFVDSERVLHTMYAREDEVYDVKTLTEMVNKRSLAVGLKLMQGDHVPAERNKTLSLPPKPAKRKAA